MTSNDTSDRDLDEALAQVQAGLVSGDAIDAVCQYRRLLRRYPSCSEARIRLGIAHIDLHELPEAIAELKLAANDPRCARQALQLLGSTYAQLGRLQEARDAWLDALAYPGVDAAVWSALMHLHSLLGDWSRAIEAGRQAIRLDGLQRPLVLSLARSLLAWSRHPECNVDRTALAAESETLRLSLPLQTQQTEHARQPDAPVCRPQLVADIVYLIGMLNAAGPLASEAVRQMVVLTASEQVSLNSDRPVLVPALQTELLTRQLLAGVYAGVRLLGLPQVLGLDYDLEFDAALVLASGAA